MQDERSKLGGKITISSVHTVRWTTCRRQSLHEHERRCGMKKASTRLLEQETQTPSPAPDLIPAESSTENLHWDWYSKRGHFTTSNAHWHVCQRSQSTTSVPVTSSFPRPSVLLPAQSTSL